MYAQQSHFEIRGARAGSQEDRPILRSSSDGRTPSLPKVQSGESLEWGRVLDLSLLHPDLTVIPPTGNQEPVRMGCTQGLGRNGWRRKEGE